MTKKAFWRVLLFCWTAVFLCVGVGKLCAYEKDRALAADGRVQTTALRTQDADLVSLFTHQNWMDYHDCLLSTNNDPQLIWQVNGYVTGLSFTLRSSKALENAELYYTTAEGQDFSLARRLVPVASDPAAGWYRFSFPQGQYVASLRLDPTSAAGAFLELGEVRLNPEKSAADYFLPTGYDAAVLLFGAPLLAAAANTVYTAFFRRKGEDNAVS